MHPKDAEVSIPREYSSTHNIGSEYRYNSKLETLLPQMPLDFGVCGATRLPAATRFASLGTREREELHTASVCTEFEVLLFLLQMATQALSTPAAG